MIDNQPITHFDSLGSEGVKTYKSLTINRLSATISYYFGERKDWGTAGFENIAIFGAWNHVRWKREGKSEWTLSEILKLSKIIGKTPDELTDFKSLTKA